MPAVSLKGIGKRYRLYPSRQEQLKEFLSFGRKERGHDFWALEDVNLDVEPGTTLGILGRNGAGKSTLLRILSGVIQPTTGTVEVNGRMAALFGIGAGFNPEFTGRDNVMLNGLLLGIERKEVLERFDDIEAFADIGEFMDRPVKTYSSGMRARLGFAVAVNVEPDILIVDETLSVGDALFKQTGLQRMRDLRDSGTTVLFVSHSMGMVKNFCDRAVLLHKGRLVSHGETAEVADRYQELISSAKTQRDHPRRVVPDDDLEYELEHEEEEDAVAPAFKEGAAGKVPRRGTGEAKIQHVELLDGSRSSVQSAPSGSTIIVRAHLRYETTVAGSVLEISLRNGSGLEVFSTDTTVEEKPLRKRLAGELVIVDFVIQVPLRPGTYNVKATLSPARNADDYLDRVDVAAVFKLKRAEDGRRVPGLVRLPTSVEIHGPEQAEPDRTA